MASRVVRGDLILDISIDGRLYVEVPERYYQWTDSTGTQRSDTRRRERVDLFPDELELLRKLLIFDEETQAIKEAK